MRATTRAAASVVALLLVPFPTARAQADSASESCSGSLGSSAIYVTNQASIRLAPDRATIFLIVDVPAATPALATERAAQGAKAVLDTLKRVGVPAGSARLVDYGAAPTPATGGAPVPGATYTARSVIRVELQNLEILSRVGTASFAAGATLMGPIQFTAAEMDGARRTALARALAQAKGDAEEMAKAAGEATFAYGDVRHNAGQCHGLSGNAELLLELYHVTRDRLWLDRAQDFAGRAQAYRKSGPDGDSWQSDVAGMNSPGFLDGAAGAGVFFLRLGAAARLRLVHRLPEVARRRGRARRDDGSEPRAHPHEEGLRGASTLRCRDPAFRRDRR